MTQLSRAMGGSLRQGSILSRAPRAQPRRMQPLINPLQVHELVHGDGAEMPDPIEFVVSDKYLDRPNLYPRQGTMLKTIFLRDDLFTQYDYDVIGEWEEQFSKYGNEGVSPMLLERIRLNKEAGRPWFREVLAVIGRRGSKGYTGALAGAYVLWNYMHRPGGPQAYYGIDRDKRLTAIVFAGKKEQAIANQWRDLTNVIVGGPCFSPYISRHQAERLTVFAPADMLRAQRHQAMGLQSDIDPASFEIIPSPSTMMAGRGPASFCQFYDEMAHVVATGANRDAEAVYVAATPSLDQFGMDAFLYEPSSPWQKNGQFFTNWEKAIEIDPETRLPAYPEMLMFQLPSWGTYLDWEEAGRIPLRPPTKKIIEVRVEVPGSTTRGGVARYETRQVERLVAGPTFQPLKRAIQAYDNQMKQLEKANPETFAVERRSHWATSMSAYLDETKVAEIFKPWRGRELFVQTHGVLSRFYKAHGDPSKSNANFGWAIAHTEYDEVSGMHHVVFDDINWWQPQDWDDHTVDYIEIQADIEDYITRFVPDEVTFDQFNSVQPIAQLRAFVAEQGFPKMINIFEKTATAPMNWKRYEVFKTAMNMGLIHAPLFKMSGGEPEVNEASEQAELELRFLEEKNGKVDHPTSGPVQVKDVSDCMVECVYALIGEQIGAYLGELLGKVGVGGALQGGTRPEEGGHGVPQSQADPAAQLGNLMGSGRANPARGMGQPSRGMRQR